VKVRRKKPHPFGNSSASSDAAFLLIIYFIVIAGFNATRVLPVNLPAADSARTVSPEDLLRFELDDAGRILYRGEVRSAAETEGAIRSALGGNPGLAVLLAVSPRAPWQAVVSFVELAQNLSIDAFSFTLAEAPPEAAR
jgi:biopolymer transport protein ExbD